MQLNRYEQKTRLSESQVTMLKVDRIKTSRFQPRTKTDKKRLKHLAASIEREGLLVPIVVRKIANTNGEESEYEVICGSRRLSAFKLIDRIKIPAVIKDITDTQVLGIALAENIHRKDLTPLERAHAYQQMVEEHGYTQEEIGRIVGYHRAEVSKALRILNVPRGTIQALESGEISMGHIRVLMRIDKNLKLLLAVLEYVIEEGFSVRKTEFLVRQLLKIQDDSDEIKMLMSGDKGCLITHTISTEKDSRVKLTLQNGKTHLEGDFEREELPEILNKLESHCTITRIPDSILKILLNIDKKDDFMDLNHGRESNVNNNQLVRKEESK
ncbi:ParB/RepB/Spo0J family partition protein [Candidatus Peregrinibacteria bacterium]|nr:ParB/RepB/Spo0J family partition protein [Candidatus Peregrinibacteria bacterium]